MSERNDKIAELYYAGYSRRAIGEAFNIGTQRVAEILQSHAIRNGLEWPPRPLNGGYGSRYDHYKPIPPGVIQMNTTIRKEIHVVAAKPGWYCLEPVKEMDGTAREFTREPVIAWRIETIIGNLWNASDAYPVSINALSDDAIGILLRPDGVITFVEDYSCGSEAEALIYYNETYPKKRTDKTDKTDKTDLIANHA